MFRFGWSKSLLYVSRFSRHASSLGTMLPLDVRNIPGEDRMQFSFSYGFRCNKERQYSLLRPKEEPLGATLNRLNANISKFIKKKNKKKKDINDSDSGDQSAQNELTVAVYHGDNIVPEDVPCDQAFTENASLVFFDSVNGDTHKYTVHVNPPTVLSLKLSTHLISRCPIVTQTETEFANVRDCKFEWFRSESVAHYYEKAEKKSSETKTEDGESSKNQMDTDCIHENGQTPREKAVKKIKREPYSVNHLKWEKVFEGLPFVPNTDDVDRRIKVICTPRSGKQSGNKEECISKNELRAGPEHFPFEKRHVLTQSPAAIDSVRVVSYNILADMYANSDFTRDFLFPYCPEYALQLDYRKQLLMKELLGYNADIICLQEVDKKLFVRDLQQLFDHVGFDGMLRVKANDSGEQGEGVATFVRRSKFRCVAQRDIILNESLQTEEMCRPLWSKISSKEALKEKILERATPLQVSVLESTDQPGRLLVVGTTHLFFHPKADNIRVMQTLLCTWHLHKVKQEYTIQGKEPTVIFCGDFNSSPGSGVHQLLTKGSILAKHADWYSGGRAEFVEGMNFQQPLHLTSACGYPEYTNYVTSFRGCLDYIYIEGSALRTSRVIPLPSTEEITEFTALPNHVFPSDHLALVCDLSWDDACSVCDENEMME